MRKQLDIKKKYNKKAFVVNKEKLIEAIQGINGITIYLDEETHWDNGESELVYRMHIKDNFV